MRPYPSMSCEVALESCRLNSNSPDLLSVGERDTGELVLENELERDGALRAESLRTE